MDPVDKIIALMIRGVADDRLLRVCEAEGVSSATIAEARARLVASLNYSRDEARALALQRMQAAYEKAVKDKDTRAMISALKEVHRLQGIFEVAPGGSDERGASESDAELQAVREHLLPLQLAPDDMPISEHARIAAEEIRRARAGT